MPDAKEYIAWIRKRLPNILITVPNTKYYEKLLIELKDKNIVLKDMEEGKISKLVSEACDNVKNNNIHYK